MRVLGIESSCDETGVALVELNEPQPGAQPGPGEGTQTVPRLLAHALHSQVDMHQAYGGVVPELASRDHIRRVLPLAHDVLARTHVELADVDLIAYTQGPGLAGALLVGAGVACALGAALGKPVLGIHHLEGHLLSPFLSADPPSFPFVALLVSGGHTQLMRVDGVGRYALLGETVDDAAGEAFDKSAKLLGLGYPGGPALARLAEHGNAQSFDLPRPLLLSGNLDIDQPIIGSIQTGKTLIDESRKKYVEAVHFAMTGTGSGALVVAGQASTYSYSFQIRPAGVSRAKSGRGIRENYLSFGLEKSDGGDFQLDRIEVQIAASINRKV